jgi:DNA-binding NtrC family response regulator
VGGSATIKVDVRVLAATSFRIEEAVSAGKLREDLLYRLNVITIALPPLRERDDDVVLLAEQVLGELNAAEGTAKRFTAACLDRLRRHRWPGNVRELRNVIEGAFILAGDELDVADLSLEGTAARAASSLVTAVGTPLADAERRLILATLDHFQGNKRQAAAALQISLNTLYSRLREYKPDVL